MRIDETQMAESVRKLEISIARRRKELAERVDAITASSADEMARRARSLLPEHWLLRSDIVSTTEYRKRRRRFVAGLSFATEGDRLPERPSRAAKPRKGKETLLDQRTPRVYAVHHDRGSERHGTPARHFLQSPLQSGAEPFRAALEAAVREVYEL